MILFHDIQPEHHCVYTNVGVGSLRTLTAKAVAGSITNDTKPALANQQQIPNVEDPCIAMDTRAGFKFISNYFINVLKYWHVNEPAPTNILGGAL